MCILIGQPGVKVHKKNICNPAYNFCLNSLKKSGTESKTHDMCIIGRTTFKVKLLHFLFLLCNLLGFFMLIYDNIYNAHMALVVIISY